MKANVREVNSRFRIILMTTVACLLCVTLNSQINDKTVQNNFKKINTDIELVFDTGAIPGFTSQSCLLASNYQTLNQTVSVRFKSNSKFQSLSSTDAEEVIKMENWMLDVSKWTKKQQGI